jgi:hypothetical protein
MGVGNHIHRAGLGLGLRTKAGMYQAKSGKQKKGFNFFHIILNFPAKIYKKRLKIA